jgi:hypothetical protein
MEDKTTTLALHHHERGTPYNCDCFLVHRLDRLGPLLSTIQGMVMELVLFLLPWSFITAGKRTLVWSACHVQLQHQQGD